MKKKSLLLAMFAILTISLILERTHYLQHRGFKLSKLISPQPCIEESPPCDVDVMLNQSFRWIGAGGTSYVFLGEDGKTILKLFKYHQLFYKHFLYSLSFPGIADAWRMGKILSIEKKQWHKRHPAFFRSCDLASSKLKKETGLIYLCLQPNAHFDRDITLIDVWGIPHHLNLSQTGFALQKKADLLFPYLQGLLKEERIEEGKRAIDSLVSLILRRCGEGIGDRDPNLRINFGFIEGQAVEFDLGSYYSDPSLNSPIKAARELFFTTFTLQQWIQERSPELLEYLLKQISNVASIPESDSSLFERTFENGALERAVQRMGIKSEISNVAKNRFFTLFRYTTKPYQKEPQNRPQVVTR